MKRRDLRKRLAAEGIDKHTYSLHGWLLPAQGYVLANIGSGWAIFYTERGTKYDAQVFDSEDEACRAFLAWILSDRTTGMVPPVQK